MPSGHLAFYRARETIRLATCLVPHSLWECRGPSTGLPGRVGARPSQPTGVTTHGLGRVCGKPGLGAACWLGEGGGPVPGGLWSRSSEDSLGMDDGLCKTLAELGGLRSLESCRHCMRPPS